MARTDQGVFKRLRNQYKEMKADYEEHVASYGDPPEDNGFFDGLAQTSSTLFDEVKVLEGEISGMLSSTKFEDDVRRKEYEDMKSNLHNIAEDLQQKFKERRDLIAMGRDGLSGIEKRTIEMMKINL